MIQTQAFKTKTILQPRQNPQTNKYWGISIDIGYSAVKIFAPNIIASFPSYATPVPYGTADNSIGGLEKTSIAYRDEDNNEYLVGAVAQDAVKAEDTDSSTSNMYVRNRYFSKEFKVISRVGLALGMMKNQYGDPSGKILHIQTGLPSEYMTTDKTSIQESLKGRHVFSIKLGRSSWIDFDFTINEENIDVMLQPMGTLTSIATDRNGGALPEAEKYFSSNLLIFDPGFGTLDTFNIQNHFPSSAKTWSNLGMLRVMQEAIATIKNEYNTLYTVPAMQKLLGDGCFTQRIDLRKTKRIDGEEFSKIIENANKKVCLEALNTIDGYYNYLTAHNYLVITGGTGAAWLNIIKNYYKDMETLKIIDGAANDTIPSIFSNVRGYYMAQLNTLKHKN